MAKLGIIPNSKGVCTAYRVTKLDGSGKYTSTFKQPEGRYFERDVVPGPTETCQKGIHCTSAFIAHSYFGKSDDTQFWEVKFKLSDVVGCDSEKIRIKGGTFKKIKRPF